VSSSISVLCPVAPLRSFLFRLETAMCSCTYDPKEGQLSGIGDLVETYRDIGPKTLDLPIRPVERNGASRDLSL